MTNKEIAEAVAVLRNVQADKVEAQVKTLITLGLQDLHSAVPAFWTKVNESFTLGTSGTDAYLVDLKEEFTDFRELRMLWIDEGSIDYINEKKFRNQNPDPTLSALGYPTKYFFRAKSLIELWPHNTTSRTVYISYYYKPKFDNIEVLPEEWTFVIFYYVMGLFEGKDEDYFKGKYADGLRRMEMFAKESEEEFTEIIGDGSDEIIYSAMETER